MSSLSDYGERKGVLFQLRHWDNYVLVYCFDNSFQYLTFSSILCFFLSFSQNNKKETLIFTYFFLFFSVCHCAYCDKHFCWSIYNYILYSCYSFSNQTTNLPNLVLAISYIFLADKSADFDVKCKSNLVEADAGTYLRSFSLARHGGRLCLELYLRNNCPRLYWAAMLVFVRIENTQTFLWRHANSSLLPSSVTSHGLM